MRSISTLILVLFVTIAFSQEIPRWVFSQGGGQESLNDIELSWTIGQSGMVGTFVAPSVVLNVGFQQFDNLMVSVENITTSSHIKLYPNPFHDQFYLAIQTSIPIEVTIQLFDNYGRLLISKEIPERSNNMKQIIPTQHLIPGLYSLLVTSVDENNKITSNNFKIIKH